MDQQQIYIYELRKAIQFISFKTKKIMFAGWSKLKIFNCY